tara:strand:+ start:26 stop:1312 length:1287 start_codon:yes stop_codon:yes gene_type:complete
MLVNHKVKILIFTWFIQLYCGCTKKDAIPPELNVQSPLSNESFQLPCDITVSGYVIDNDKVDRVEIDLVSENSATIVQGFDIDADSLYFEYDLSLIIEDRLLLSGNYFINIKAYDEFENFTSKYISIYLNEIPKTLESLIYITSNSNQTFIYQQDSLGNFQLVKQLLGTHILSMGNSRSQHLFVGSDQNGEFFDLNNFNHLWNVPVVSSNYPLFIDLSKSDNGDQSHLVLGDGRIVSYNKNGNIVNSIYSNPQELFGKFNIQNNIVLVESFSSFLDRDLVVYFRQSGIEKQRVEINGEIVKIVPVLNNEYAIFSQFLNVSKISIYYENFNQLYTDLELPNSIIYDAIFINNYLIFSSSSGLYKYDFNLNILNQISPNIKASKIIPNEMDSFIYLTVGTELWTYSLNGNLSLLSDYGDSIRNFIPVYNK